MRLVAATNEDLPTLAEQGRFRYDLLDRLAFDVITLPPLRAREEDVQLLAEHFAINMAKELGRDLFSGFSEAVRETMQNYHWPGNIRELKNVVERCVYRTEPDELVTEVTFDPFDSPFRIDGRATAANRETNGATASSFGTPTLPLDLKEHIKAHEIELIEQAMQDAKHNQRKAADLLGLTYHQLRGYLKKYELVGQDA